MFNSSALFDIGLDPSTLYPFVAPRPRALPIGTHRIESPPEVPIPIRPSAHLTKKKCTDPDGKVRSEHQYIPFLGSEEEEELRDSVSPKYDQLKISKWWWFVELLPLHLRYQRGDSQWITYFGCVVLLVGTIFYLMKTIVSSNLARPRFIPNQKAGLKIHRSVKLRMEAEFEDEKKRKKGKRYIPKPAILVEPTWVD